MQKNLFVQYLIWHFFDIPKELGKAWKNYLRFYFNFFSIAFLSKTLFHPWHGISWSYGRGFSPSRYIRAFASNSFSRIIGAIVRIFLIIFGLLFNVLILLIGAIFFFGWLFLPAMLVISFIFGANLLF